MADQLPQPTTTGHPTDQPPTTNISHCYPTKKKKHSNKHYNQNPINQNQPTRSTQTQTRSSSSTTTAQPPPLQQCRQPPPAQIHIHQHHLIKKKKKKTTTRKIVAATTTRKTTEPTTHPPTTPEKHQKNCCGHNPFTDLRISHHRFRRFRTHSPISHHRFRRFGTHSPISHQQFIDSEPIHQFRTTDFAQQNPPPPIHPINSRPTHH